MSGFCIFIHQHTALHVHPTHIESELTDLLRSKDQKAYNYLYDHYGGALYGVIFKIVNSETMAKDILQEVFVKIWKHIDKYDATKGRLFTWMLNIARNAAIDALRSKEYKQEQRTGELEHVVHANVSMNIDHIGLNKVLDSLKTEQKTVIDMAYFKGYTQDEIAKALDMPLGTVKSRIRSALIHLKNILQ